MSAGSPLGTQEEGPAARAGFPAEEARRRKKAARRTYEREHFMGGSSVKTLLYKRTNTRG
jgi:hypothetical protein